MKRTLAVIGMIALSVIGVQAQTKAQFDALSVKVAALQKQVEALTSQLSAANALSQYVYVDYTTLNGIPGPRVVIHDANVQILSGSGNSVTINGYGNLILGYNEPWTSNPVRTGSGNFVMGRYNDYSGYGGFVSGESNVIGGAHASIISSGGSINNGADSVIISGAFNRVADWRAGAVMLSGVSNIQESPYSILAGGENVDNPLTSYQYLFTTGTIQGQVIGVTGVSAP